MATSTGQDPSLIGVPQSTSAAILGVAPRVVDRLAKEGKIRTIRIPGCRVKYVLADIQKLAAESRGDTRPGS